MNILIFGGTAFFGCDIVELALEARHRVTVFSRGNQKPASFWNDIEHIAGDRHSQADLAAKLKGRQFEAVVDNIGRYVFTSSSMENSLEDSERQTEIEFVMKYREVIAQL